MSMPAVVLAGERPGGNDLARAFHEPAGVLVEVAGRPCISRALSALEDSRNVEGGLICGPDPATRATSPVIRGILAHTEFDWLPPAEGPAESALASLEKLGEWPVLLTAGDHALLTGPIVDGFCDQALALDADFVVGFVPYDRVREAFPGTRRTVLRFADGAFCGSNLYLVRTQDGVRVLDLWRAIQQHRKRPWRIATAIGLGTLFAYLARRLTVAEAVAHVGARAGCRVSWVEISEPRAAVDVDSIADHALAERILAE